MNRHSLQHASSTVANVVSSPAHLGRDIYLSPWILLVIPSNQRLCLYLFLYACLSFAASYVQPCDVHCSSCLFIYYTQMFLHSYIDPGGLMQHKNLPIGSSPNTLSRCSFRAGENIGNKLLFFSVCQISKRTIEISHTSACAHTYTHTQSLTLKDLGIPGLLFNLSTEMNQKNENPF